MPKASIVRVVEKRKKKKTRTEACIFSIRENGKSKRTLCGDMTPRLKIIDWSARELLTNRT